MPRDSRTRESPQKDEPGGSSIAEGNANLEEGQYVSNVGKENYPGLVGAAVCREKEWSGQSRITAATDTCAGGEAALYYHRISVYVHIIAYMHRPTLMATHIPAHVVVRIRTHIRGEHRGSRNSPFARTGSTQGSPR